MSKFLRIGGRGEDGTAKPIKTDDEGRVNTVDDDNSVYKKYLLYEELSPDFLKVVLNDGWYDSGRGWNVSDFGDLVNVDRIQVDNGSSSFNFRAGITSYRGIKHCKNMRYVWHIGGNNPLREIDRLDHLLLMEELRFENIEVESIGNVDFMENLESLRIDGINNLADLKELIYNPWRLASLERLRVRGCNFDGQELHEELFELPYENLTSEFEFQNCGLTGAIPEKVSKFVNTNRISFSTNNFTSYEAGAFATQFNTTQFRVNQNALSQSDIDQILSDLVTNLNLANRTETAVVRLEDNSAPSSSGMADKQTLINAGWTVETD
jgi:hypothetical protein